MSPLPCILHDISRCASCLGIERYEAPEPSEGKVRKQAPYGAGVVKGPERPAVIFEAHGSKDHHEWNPGSTPELERPKSEPHYRRQFVRGKGAKARYRETAPTERAALRNVGNIQARPPALSPEQRQALDDLRGLLPA